ncbi:uncharacterized protein LOC115091708 [Rhinatrema bivittatum]|uniref:uncharacterized protein LOC115091708 n=1 Tax=Rhinatrema bivittatum TaxID=194408 RepID=UPI00112830F1|nr:uncharacterized protein LOC115091708 [Rhinatrema bivittatum]
MAVYETPKRLEMKIVQQPKLKRSHKRKRRAEEGGSTDSDFDELLLGQKLFDSQDPNLVNENALDSEYLELHKAALDAEADYLLVKLECTENEGSLQIEEYGDTPGIKMNCICCFCPSIKEPDTCDPKKNPNPEDVHDFSWWSYIGFPKPPPVHGVFRKTTFRSIVRVAVYSILTKCLAGIRYENCEGCVLDDASQDDHSCVYWTASDTQEQLRTACNRLCLERV